MTDPAVISAVAAAVGVVVGSVASSLGIVLRERVVGRRERETQEALRQQQLADQRAAFQRDTVLALQDAIGPSTGLRYLIALRRESGVEIANELPTRPPPGDAAGRRPSTAVTAVGE